MNKTSLKFIFGLCFTALALQSCGKHESTGAVLGTTSGAVLGAAVAGRRDKGTGAVLGGLIGGILGGSVGRGADEEIEDERVQRKFAQREAASERAARRKQQEVKVVVCRQDVERWCSGCHRRNTLVGARSCTDCGCSLICEKFCRSCGATFSPVSSYKYCPYCSSGHRLAMQ